MRWSVSPEARTLVEVGGRTLSLSHLDKVLFPATGFTKGDLIDYYVRIAPVLLPHVRDRPLTMRRFPDGVSGQSFYGKHLPAHAPDWVDHVAVPSTDGGEDVDYVVLCDLPPLVWAANLASIELHVPLWHVGRRRSLPAPPDHIVFDLDPGPGTSVVECCRVALEVVERLGSLGKDAVAKTSGSKGLQVYAPLPARWTWERCRSTAHDLADLLARDHPDDVVSNMRRSLRDAKVLIDWSQNHPAKTTVAVYSLRAVPEPRASTPVTWDEVAACAKSDDPSELVFGPDEVLERVESMGDLFAKLLRS
jgi:bifunctional non-homologous end joining protein LigD